MSERTLAAALGTTTHLSPLLRKARKLGLEELREAIAKAKPRVLDMVHGIHHGQ